jgi:hypothetical protein
MSSVGFGDFLSLVQTSAIIAALMITVYFWRQQMRAQARDLETRVLTDLSEQLHRIAEITIDRPEMLRIISQRPGVGGAEVPFAYYLLFFFAHIFHMRQRGILADNEWEGWHQWMKNAFRWGTLGQSWKAGDMGAWFDPAFRSFVDSDLQTPAG